MLGDGVWRPEYLSLGGSDLGPGWYAIRTEFAAGGGLLSSFRGPFVEASTCAAWCESAQVPADEVNPDYVVGAK